MTDAAIRQQFNALSDDDFVEYAQAIAEADEEKGRAGTKRVLVYLSQPDIMICDPVHVSGTVETRTVTFEGGSSISVSIGMS